MTLDNNNIQVPAEENLPVEETNLQMEELEARVAPSEVWGD